MVSVPAGLAVGAPEEAVSTVVAAFAGVWGLDSLGADRVSVPECPGTFAGVTIFAIGGSMIGSFSSAIRSFTIRFSTDSIPTPTAIIHTATILTDMIPMVTDMDTIPTINLVTVALRTGTGGLPQSGTSRDVWRGQAITAARSTG
jgi:hypothetical protein